MQGKDPAKVIREALGKTLVFYYPFAGRLRKGRNRKLMVDCTGEGVLFIKVDADVKLEQFGEELLPPFPCLDQLLYNVPSSRGMLNCPLRLIEVTCTHHEFDKVDDIKSCSIFTPLENMVHRSFFFNPSHISTICRFVALHLCHCSTFEVLTACLWRCRTLALQFDPDEQVRLLCIVNVCSKFNPPLPKGYYGNTIVHPVVVTIAGKLCQNP
ncbi:hypothetical protein POUND7_000780 [Theobroma cacao]